MLDQTFGPYVRDVRPGCLGQLLIEPQGAAGVDFPEVLNGFLDCCGTLLGSEGGFTWDLEQISVELLQQAFTVWDEGLGVCAELVQKFEDGLDFYDISGDLACGVHHFRNFLVMSVIS